MHPNIDRAICFLKEHTLEVAEGRIEIDGDNVFANVITYEPKVLEESTYEAHERYIDIQIILEGKEHFYNAPLEEVSCIVPYDETKDIGFYKGEIKGECMLEPGKFVLCMPTDAHMPGVTCGISPLKKMVVKVKVK